MATDLHIGAELGEFDSPTGEVTIEAVTPEAIAASALVRAGVDPSHFSGAYLHARNAAISAVREAHLVSPSVPEEAIMAGLDRSHAAYHFSRQVVGYALAQAGFAARVISAEDYDTEYGEGAARRLEIEEIEETRNMIQAFEGDK